MWLIVRAKVLRRSVLRAAPRTDRTEKEELCSDQPQTEDTPNHLPSDRRLSQNCFIYLLRLMKVGMLYHNLW